MRLALFVIWMAAVETVWPVVMKPLSIEELACRAHLVVRGTILSKSCQRDPAGRIYTKIELSVTEVWKGQTQQGLLTVVHGGGILGEERVVVSGQAEYQLDEDVVLFLVRNDRGEGVTVGLGQGKFHVWKDAGIFLAQNPFHGPAVGKSTGSPAAGRLTLAALKARVQGDQP